MKELLYEVNLAAVNEKERANKKFPMFHSAHEAYGVIKEEYEEARADLTAFQNLFDDYWGCVKRNDTVQSKFYLESMRDIALHGAAEMVQVSAMAQKALDSMNSSISVGSKN